MSFYASAWQIALAALLPVFFCLLLFLADAKGPLAKPIQQCKGLVAPYFTVISATRSSSTQTPRRPIATC